MKDAVATMGAVLPDDAGGRDAVHVAVFSATAQTDLKPGEHVSLVSQGSGDAEVWPAGQGIGIVDPFIQGKVNAGQRFWVYLYPRSITGLSHKWSHPAFEDVATSYANPATKLASEQWLRNFCATADCPGYEAVMAVVENGYWSGDDYVYGRIDGEYMFFSGSDAHGEIPDEFWTHAEIVLGHPIKSRPSYFSCSC